VNLELVSYMSDASALVRTPHSCCHDVAFACVVLRKCLGSRLFRGRAPNKVLIARPLVHFVWLLSLFWLMLLLPLLLKFAGPPKAYPEHQDPERDPHVPVSESVPQLPAHAAVCTVHPVRVEGLCGGSRLPPQAPRGARTTWDHSAMTLFVR
jgi:hypothetical protein